jgi:predicted sugar kinase
LPDVSLVGCLTIKIKGAKRPLASSGYECGGAMKGEIMSESLMKMGAAVARKSLNEAVDRLDHLERHLLKLDGEKAEKNKEEACREIFQKLSEVNNWLHAIEHS